MSPGTPGGPGEDELDPDVLEELEFWIDPDEDEAPPQAPDPGPAPGVTPAGPSNDPEGPAGALVLVGTPIGNLEDLSPRAVVALRTADLIYCEDTRHSRKLLTHAGITGVPLRSLHEHNEEQRIAEVLAAVGEGRTVALVSDAGMPGVSDPGGRVVGAAGQAGLTVTVVPGPSAVLAALVTSGLSTERFCFEGFLPRSGRARRERLAALAGEPRTSVLFEAPGRVAATLGDLVEVCGGARPVAVARELTKVHEEVWRGTLAESAARSDERPWRGEVVVVLAGAPTPGAPEVSDGELTDALLGRLGEGERTRGVVDEVAATFGVPRRRVYHLALAARGPGGTAAPGGAGGPGPLDGPPE